MCHTTGWEGALQLAVGLHVCRLPVGHSQQCRLARLGCAGPERHAYRAYPLLILQLLRPYKMFHSPLTSTAPITARRRQKKASS